ncbi:MAG: cytoplasmic protein [Cycloclasticus sp.]|nr:MAG: cytoplasmic protein [Cycloclasticus sp.]
MIDLHNIEQLAKSLTGQLPDGLGNIKDDVEKNFKSVLQQQFVKLDLVTREEFDTQNAVLARTREKLYALEKIITELKTSIK